MAANLRNGIKTGLTFAIITIFFMATGFLVVLAGIFAGETGMATADLLPPNSLLIALGVLGVFCGLLATKGTSSIKESLGKTFFSGLTAGLFSGLFSYLIGTIRLNGMDMRTYFPALSPESVDFYSNYQPALISTVLIYTIIFTSSSLIAGLLFCGFQRAKIQEKIQNTTHSISQNPNFTSTIRSPWMRYGFIVITLILLAVLPRTWGAYWNYIMGTVGIYIILGLGLNIIVGYSGQLVLGYVAFYAIGAYTYALLTAPEPHHIMLNFWVALVIGIVVAGLTGVLLGLPILNLRGDYLAIVTLGFGEIIRILLKSDLLKPFTAGPSGVRKIGQPTLFGQPFSSDIDFMYLIIVAVLVGIFIAYRLQNSRTGRAWLSIKEDEIAAKAAGINAFRSKLLALALGAAFAGLAGVLFASRSQFTGPEDHVMMVSINVLCLVIVGGMGSIPGVILGSFVLKGLPELLRGFDNYRMLAFGALLIVMMIMRPEGLWPGKRPKMAFSDSTSSSGKEQTA
jgi:branched-chain amino acid transport system permease protein